MLSAQALVCLCASRSAAYIRVFLLIGIVKKNAIMIIDCALEAEREACLLRLRLILMTTLAAALGTLPLAIGFGEGSELRRPLGVAVIGGLLASQLLTVLTTPVVYVVTDKLRRASLFPTVKLGVRGERSGGREIDSGSRYRLNIGGSWEPDLWGRLRNGVTGARAGASASAADLAAARLSAQDDVAANYFAVRQSDAQRALLAQTIEGYARVATTTKNRYEAGTVGKSDVLQAQTQLANAQADELSLSRQRAQFEHAFAILVGKAPAEFSLARAPWTVNVPDIPAGVPSTLLQRRPDIAAAERRVEAANAQIGIARSAYYPNIGLTGSLGTGGSKVGDLLSVSTWLWSFGPSVAQSIFNAGATRANVAGAEAGQQVAVARYRQTVLEAFGDVENQQAAARILGQQQVLRRQASEAADQVEQQMLNRDKTGQVGYTEVVQAPPRRCRRGARWCNCRLTARARPSR